MINNNNACSEHVAEFTSCRLLKTKFIELLEAIGPGGGTAIYGLYRYVPL